MAKLYNLARMTTATTGTGTITLGAAVSGYLTFALAGVANGDVVDYAIKDGANSEIGTGTYTTAGTTLTRTVTNSTNGNAAINLSGLAEVFISPRAQTLAKLDQPNAFTQSGSFAQTLSVGAVTGSAGVTLAITGNGTLGLEVINPAVSGSSGTGAGIVAHAMAVPLASGERLGFYIAGYTDLTTQRNSAGMNVYSSQAWTVGSAQGSYIDVEVTANGTAARALSTRFNQSGGVTIGGTFDPGAAGRLHVANNINIGAAVAADSSVTANLNTSATVAPTFASAFHGVGADGVNIALAIDSFGASSPVLLSRNAGGTLASKTAVGSAATLGVWVAQGWTGSAYLTGGQVLLRTSATWTGSTAGTEIALRPTPNSGQVLFDHTVARQDGTLNVGTTTLGGPGSIVVNAGIGAGNVAPIQSGDVRGFSTAKAWVRFTGTSGTNSSFQVSSITKTAAGDYTVNFTTAQPDTAYMFLVTCDGKNAAGADFPCVPNSYVIATTAMAFKTTGASGTPTDNNYINVAIFH